MAKLGLLPLVAPPFVGEGLVSLGIDTADFAAMASWKTSHCSSHRSSSRP